MYSVTKAFKFDAAHRLFTMPENHKCRNIHGHSYVVRVSIKIEDIKKNPNNPNMVVDFGLLKEFQEYLDQFDHTLILHEEDPLHKLLFNEVCITIMPFKLDVTAENMAFVFANRINYMCQHNFNIHSGQICVEVDETTGNTASYVREIGEV